LTRLGVGNLLTFKLAGHWLVKFERSEKLLAYPDLS
jgi:hypothetical protein